jgi:hypothetical protein
MSDQFWDIVQTDQESIWASHGYWQEMFLSISPTVVFWSGDPFLPLSDSMQYSTWPFGKVQCLNAMKNSTEVHFGWSASHPATFIESCNR